MHKLILDRLQELQNSSVLMVLGFSMRRWWENHSLPFSQRRWVHLQRRAMHCDGTKESVDRQYLNNIKLILFEGATKCQTVSTSQMSSTAGCCSLRWSPTFLWSFLKTRRTTTRRFRPLPLTKRTMSTSLSISTSQCPSSTSSNLKKLTMSTTWSLD